MGRVSYIDQCCSLPSTSSPPFIHRQFSSSIHHHHHHHYRWHWHQRRSQRCTSQSHRNKGHKRRYVRRITLNYPASAQTKTNPGFSAHTHPHPTPPTSPPPQHTHTTHSLLPPNTYNPLIHTYTHAYTHTQLYLAANPHLTDDVVGAGVAPRVGGAYFSDCRPKRTTREAEVRRLCVCVCILVWFFWGWGWVYV
jgi:hypothetical protein